MANSLPMTNPNIYGDMCDIKITLKKLHNTCTKIK